MKTILGFFLALTLTFGAHAQQLEVDLQGGMAAALPIAVLDMPYQGASSPPDTDISAVIRGDLNRSGRFRTLPVEDIVERPTRGAEVVFDTWRVLRQDYLVIGRVLDTVDPDSARVEYELFNVATRQRLIGQAMTARRSGLRDVAHQMADAIFEAITGLRGAFWTRIAYVTAHGAGDNARYALVVADSDGYNPQEVVRSTQPLLGPAWSPDGRKLAYVNFEHGNSEIWIQDLSSGQRTQVSSFRGINSAPAFSPDGRKLALTLSHTGNPEIHVMDLGSKSLVQLTRHYGIDTSPVWSADGQTIYFTSDRSGQPQIYQVSAGGGEAQRVSFEGRYNADPSVSFDGHKMAVTQGAGNVYRIAVMDRSLGAPRWSMVSPGALDESPSFAPNASMLIYASREGGQGVLYAVSADGRVRQRLRMENGDVRVPAWGPYRTQR